MLLSLCGRGRAALRTCLSVAQIIGFGSALLEDVDPNPANFVGAGIIHTRTTQIGCLLRLEPNLQAQVRLVEQMAVRGRAVFWLCCAVGPERSPLTTSDRCVPLGSPLLSCWYREHFRHSRKFPGVHSPSTRNLLQTTAMTPRSSPHPGGPSCAPLADRAPRSCLGPCGAEPWCGRPSSLHLGSDWAGGADPGAPGVSARRLRLVAVRLPVSWLCESVFATSPRSAGCPRGR